MTELLYADRITVGGVYAMRRSSGGYQVWLVVALDPEAVHIAFYDDFDELPALADVRAKQPHPEYAFMTRESWAEGHLNFIGVKGVVDSDLQGYYKQQGS